MVKRLFDIALSIIGLVLLFPIFLIIALIILPDTKGRIFYCQKRVGRHDRDFNLIKFRTMIHGADKKVLITVGADDKRITPTGRLLRRHKLDELPQLINILVGDMSFVGPRPEVRKYVDLYDHRQRKVLSVQPGLTDLASLEYYHENEMLKSHPDPESLYIRKIMPAKLELNLQYISDQNFKTDLRILSDTLKRVFSK